MSGLLAFPQVHFLVHEIPPVCLCSIMNCKEAWKSGEWQGKQETLQQRSVSWFFLLSCLSGFDASATHQSPGQRSQFTLPASQSGKLPAQAVAGPAGSSNPPSSSRAWQAGWGEAAATSPQLPKNYFSHYPAKADSLKGLLVPWCLPSHH